MQIDRMKSRNEIPDRRDQRNIVPGDRYVDQVAGRSVRVIVDGYVRAVAHVDGYVGVVQCEIAGRLHLGHDCGVVKANRAATSAQAARVIHLDLLVENPSEIAHSHEENKQNGKHQCEFHKALAPRAENPEYFQIRTFSWHSSM